MKASELIVQLQDAIEAVGDQELIVDDGCGNHYKQLELFVYDNKIEVAVL